METTKRPKILLITSTKVGDTGRISFKYIFQDDELEAYKKFPEQCGGPFGVMTKIEKGFHFNLFEGTRGFICGGPIYPGREEPMYHNAKIDEIFPKACSFLCTREIADAIKPILEKLGCHVDVLFSEQTLLTA